MRCFFTILKSDMNVTCICHKKNGDFMSGDFLSYVAQIGVFLSGDFMSYVAQIGDFLSGDFMSGDFLTGYRTQHPMFNYFCFKNLFKLMLYCFHERRPLRSERLVHQSCVM